jgi:hypothetical protein
VTCVLHCIARRQSEAAPCSQHMGSFRCQQADRAPCLRSTLAATTVVMTGAVLSRPKVPRAAVRQLSQAGGGLRWQAGLIRLRAHLAQPATPVWCRPPSVSLFRSVTAHPRFGNSSPLWVTGLICLIKRGRACRLKQARGTVSRRNKTSNDRFSSDVRIFPCFSVPLW